MLRHEVKIGNNDFFIMRYAPFQALEILGDLQQRFAAPLLEALGEAPQQGDKANPNPLMPQPASAGDKDAFASLLTGLSKISASMNGRELATLARRLIDPERISVSINGAEAQKLTPMMIEASGMSPADVIALCVEIVRHNFQDFFSRFAAPIGQAQAFLRQNPSAGSATH